MAHTFSWRIVLALAVLIVIDLYIFSGLRNAFSSFRGKMIAGWIYWILTVSFYSLMVFLFASYASSGSPSIPVIKLTMGFFMFFYIPKLVLLLFFGSEDIFRLLRAGTVGIGKFAGFSADDTPFFISRRQFIGRAAGFAAVIPAVSILHGIVCGKYNYKIHRASLSFKNLPDAFHGLTITQISDLHVGSFDDADAVKQAVELINNEKSDLLFFTGDMVNYKAEEMKPWTDIFSKLHAPLGKYSVLGNHDYGDYVNWNSAEEKHENLRKLFSVHEQIGFRLLRNQNTRIEKNGQFLDLLGVENWGRGFVKYGDLDKTLSGTKKDSFKILLSHDPSHWEDEVMEHSENIDLTLSGHTHGAQFGVEIPGFRFSPVQLRYKRWAGLYEENNRYLYVNRGLGFIGFPGRVGIWPEITVITLNKA